MSSTNLVFPDCSLNLLPHLPTKPDVSVVQACLPSTLSTLLLWREPHWSVHTGTGLLEPLYIVTRGSGCSLEGSHHIITHFGSLQLGLVQLYSPRSFLGQPTLCACHEAVAVCCPRLIASQGQQQAYYRHTWYTPDILDIYSSNLSRRELIPSSPNDSNHESQIKILNQVMNLKAKNSKQLHWKTCMQTRNCPDRRLASTQMSPQKTGRNFPASLQSKRCISGTHCFSPQGSHSFVQRCWTSV